jgi:drug/metabolite transporter (DMT)-like permease
MAKIRGMPAPFFVLLLGTLFGSSLVVSRFSVGQFDPRTFVAVRISIAAALHMSVYLFGRNLSWPRDRSVWLRAGILGVIGTAVPMTSIVSSLQYQSSGVASLLLTLNPVVTVLLAQRFLVDEGLTWRRLAGVLVAFGGAGLLLINGETGLAEFARADWRGYAWIGIGILSGSAGVVYARRFLRHENAFDVATIRMIGALVVTVPITWLTVGFDMSRVVWSGVAALVYGSVVGTFFAFMLNFYIIKRFGATPASQTSYVIPVVSTILGVIFLGETVSPIMFVGMLLIFAGITLLNWRTRRPLAEEVAPVDWSGEI